MDRRLGRQGFPHEDSRQIPAVTRVLLSTISPPPFRDSWRIPAVTRLALSSISPSHSVTLGGFWLLSAVSSLPVHYRQWRCFDFAVYVKKVPFGLLPRQTRLPVPARCRVLQNSITSGTWGQLTPRRHAIYSGEPRRKFNLSVHASLTIFVRQVGCFITCGIRSRRSYPVPRHGRVVVAHPATILSDIVVAPPWAAMYASPCKRARDTAPQVAVAPPPNACPAGPADSASSHLISSSSESLLLSIVSSITSQPFLPFFGGLRLRSPLKFEPRSSGSFSFSCMSCLR